MTSLHLSQAPAGQKVKFSVIVLNWNRRQFLPECLDSLDSLAAAQTVRDFEVVLVDNGSDDGSLQYIRDAYPWVNLVGKVRRRRSGLRSLRRRRALPAGP